jgi:hypothetical protein
MKKKTNHKLLLSMLVLFTLLALMPYCGGRHFVTPAFYDKAEGHRIIAVVPFQMIFKGKKPKKLSVRQIREIEESESLAFQDSLHRLLFRQSVKHRNPIRINIQDVDKTNDILEKKGIEIRDTWGMNSEELASILQVDAVVRTRVIKHRYMSGLASFGVEVGNAVLNAILEDTPLQIFVPNPTKKIHAECSLDNGRDGTVLWEIDVNENIDWRLSANDIIDHINHFFARKFPYR